MPPVPQRIRKIEGRVIQLYKRKFKSAVDIGRQLGICSNTVNRILRDNGVRKRTTKEAMRMRFGRAFPAVYKIAKWKWHTLAWVIQTEGSIGFLTWKRSNKFGGPLVIYPYIHISTKDKRIVTGLMSQFGEIGNILQRRENMRFNKDDTPFVMWGWTIRGREAMHQILPRIIPHLRAKRLQARILLWYCRSRLRTHNGAYTPLELLTVKWVRELNIRGRAFERTLAVERRIEKMAVRRGVLPRIYGDAKPEAVG